MIKLLGFFDELNLYPPTGLKIMSNLKTKAHDWEGEIINYLSNGVLLAVSPGIVFDVLSKDEKIAGIPNLLTDGEWVWYEILGYYVKNYHVSLPQEFISFAEKNNWKISMVDEHRLNQIEKEFMEQLYKTEKN